MNHFHDDDGAIIEALAGRYVTLDIPAEGAGDTVPTSEEELALLEDEVRR